MESLMIKNGGQDLVKTHSPLGTKLSDNTLISAW